VNDWEKEPVREHRKIKKRQVLRGPLDFIISERNSTMLRLSASPSRVTLGGKTALRGANRRFASLPPPPPAGLRSRAEMLASLKQSSPTSPYDIFVVGGGATGSGTAMDAANRGLKVACVERGDFGSETSSRSTKLIWAGSRYLFNVVAALTSSKMITAPKETIKKCMEEFHMVLGCARERRYMAEKNQHLVNWIPIALPFNQWVIWPPPMGAWAFAFMPIACRLNAVKWFYDSLAGFTSPSSYVMSKAQSMTKFPQLTNRGINFCAILHEAAAFSQTVGEPLTLTLTLTLI